jgi:hypothetical protein
MPIRQAGSEFRRFSVGDSRENPQRKSIVGTRMSDKGDEKGLSTTAAKASRKCRYRPDRVRNHTKLLVHLRQVPLCQIFSLISFRSWNSNEWLSDSFSLPPLVFGFHLISTFDIQPRNPSRNTIISPLRVRAIGRNLSNIPSKLSSLSCLRRASSLTSHKISSPSDFFSLHNVVCHFARLMLLGSIGDIEALGGFDISKDWTRSPTKAVDRF